MLLSWAVVVAGSYQAGRTVSPSTSSMTMSTAGAFIVWGSAGLLHPAGMKFDGSGGKICSCDGPGKGPSRGPGNMHPSPCSSLCQTICAGGISSKRWNPAYIAPHNEAWLTTGPTYRSLVGR